MQAAVAQVQITSVEQTAKAQVVLVAVEQVETMEVARAILQLLPAQTVLLIQEVALVVVTVTALVVMAVQEL
jgi:hypothetical protein